MSSVFNVKKLSAVVKLTAEINKFVAVTNGPEFCLETALLFNDTHNILLGYCTHTEFEVFIVIDKHKIICNLPKEPLNGDTSPAHSGIHTYIHTYVSRRIKDDASILCYSEFRA